MRYNWYNGCVSRVRRALAAVALGLFLLPVEPAGAYEPLAYPGSLWGYGYREFNGLEGTAIQGHLTQGVDWAKLPYGLTFNTFGLYNWRFRTLNQDYFNAHGPALGAVLRRGSIEAGVDYNWQEYPLLHQPSQALEFFADWYKDWELDKVLGQASWRGRVIKGLPLTTWGRVSVLGYERNDVEGTGTMGWVKQGVRWLKLPYQAGLVTFASYNWRLRSLNRPYYNTHGPSVGVEVSQRYASLGLQYDWRSFPELHQDTRSLQLYLIWYLDWDLKKR